MEPIKEGEVVLLKTTAEKVFVLQLEGEVAKVRRATVGTDGIKHLTESFLIAELTTPADHLESEFALQEGFYKKHSPAPIDKSVQELLPN